MANDNPRERAERSNHVLIGAGNEHALLAVAGGSDDTRESVLKAGAIHEFCIVDDNDMPVVAAGGLPEVLVVRTGVEDAQDAATRPRAVAATCALAVRGSVRSPWRATAGLRPEQCLTYRRRATRPVTSCSRTWRSDRVSIGSSPYAP